MRNITSLTAIAVVTSLAITSISTAQAEQPEWNKMSIDQAVGAPKPQPMQNNTKVVLDRSDNGKDDLKVTIENANVEGFTIKLNGECSLAYQYETMFYEASKITCGSNVTREFSNFTGSLWPLQVGKSVSFDMTGRNAKRGDSWNGKVTCKVAVYDTLPTAAGDLAAFRVDCADENVKSTAWFAPGLGMLAQADHKHKNGHRAYFQIQSIN